MRPFSLLIKPTSADCNLRCAYCFYLDRQSLYPETRRHRMTLETLDRMISSYMATSQPRYTFGWQGGEPTLMGVDFFRKVTELQARHGRAGVEVSNGLQTNGILIDDAFARHLSRYHFLVGLSVDGPAEVHDRYRRFAEGRGSHELVMKALDTLRRNRVEYNILTLVNNVNVRTPRAIYQYLCDQEIFFHQYIECVEFDSSGGLLPFAVTPEAWGEFLCEIFDQWYPNDTRRVSIRLFDSILSKMVDNRETVCSMGTDCRQYFVVEHNADIYPCDFFVRPELKLGNLFHDTWEKMLASEKYQAFGRRKRQWNEECARCPFLPYCAGDCPKNRPGQGEEPTRLSVLCEGWKRFYSHTLERFEKLATEIREERRRRFVPAIPPPAKASGSGGKVGRNDPCPCGSGRKYKRCCGA